MLKSAVQMAAIEKGGTTTVLDDAEVETVIRKQVKQRRDSIAGFEKGGRPVNVRVEGQLVATPQHDDEPALREVMKLDGRSRIEKNTFWWSVPRCVIWCGNPAPTTRARLGILHLSAISTHNFSQLFHQNA